MNPTKYSREFLHVTCQICECCGNNYSKYVLVFDDENEQTSKAYFICKICFDFASLCDKRIFQFTSMSIKNNVDEVYRVISTMFGK